MMPQTSARAIERHAPAAHASAQRPRAVLYAAALLHAVFFLTSFSACSQKRLASSTDTATKFDWTANYSAPKYYPVDVYTGFFGSDEGFITPIGGSGSTHLGMWGSSGASIISGPEYKAVPSLFSVTWIAFAEKKTYTCEGRLDAKKILELFRQGVHPDRQGRARTYNYITVGLAPGGLVCVWLAGSGVKTEIGCFQGKEAPDVPVEEYTPNPTGLSRAALIQQGYEDEVDAALRKALDEGTASIPVGLWQSFRTRYAWRPALDLPAGAEPAEMLIRYFNGEAEVLTREKLRTAAAAARAVPRSLQITWESADTTYVCRAEIKEESTAARDAILKAFAAAFGTEGGGEPGAFLVRIQPDGRSVQFLLKKEARVVEVSGLEYRVFRNPRNKKP